MRKLLLKIFFWFQWKQLHHDMNSVVGFKTLNEANEYIQQLECKIRKENNLNDNEKLVFENTRKNMEDFAFYLTIKQFIKKGEFIEKSKLMLHL